MSGSQQILLGGSAVAIDPYFSSVIMLAHMEDGNGFTGTLANNGTGFPFVTQFNCAISNAQAKYGTTSLAGGNTFWVCQTISSSDYNWGTGDFTLEFYVYLLGSQNSWLFMFQSPGKVEPHIYVTTTGLLVYSTVNTDRITSAASAFTFNAWQEVALCRASGSSRLFLNGTQVGSTYSDTSNAIDSYGAMLGVSGADYIPFYGYCDDVRITSAARYTSNYTPHTAPFPNS